MWPATPHTAQGDGMETLTQMGKKIQRCCCQAQPRISRDRGSVLSEQEASLSDNYSVHWIRLWGLTQAGRQSFSLPAKMVSLLYQELGAWTRSPPHGLTIPSLLPGSWR